MANTGYWENELHRVRRYCYAMTGSLELGDKLLRSALKAIANDAKNYSDRFSRVTVFRYINEVVCVVIRQARI